jgi:hypothetical protein
MTKHAVRKLFCCYYVQLGNIYEAGIRAGFQPENSLSEGMNILSKRSYIKLIEKLSSSCPTAIQIQAGLERLAFGSANDAVLLAFSEETPSPAMLSKLDLFNVSEIKRIKGGGIEIKLFDRQKALEKLYEYANSTDVKSSAESLINALRSSEDNLEA